MFVDKYVFNDCLFTKSYEYKEKKITNYFNNAFSKIYQTHYLAILSDF